MNLLEFKDLPDTTTPITADNLNSNFNELENNLNATIENVSNIQSIVNTLSNKNRTKIDFTPVSGSQAAGGWRKLFTNETITLNKGFYIFIISVNLSGDNTMGVCTAKALVNNDDYGRSTIPMLNLTMSTQLVIIRKITEDDTTITLNCEGYGNRAFNVQGGYVNYFKID